MPNKNDKIVMSHEMPRAYSTMKELFSEVEAELPDEFTQRRILKEYGPNAIKNYRNSVADDLISQYFIDRKDPAWDFPENKRLLTQAEMSSPYSMTITPEDKIAAARKVNQASGYKKWLNSAKVKAIPSGLKAIKGLSALPSLPAVQGAFTDSAMPLTPMDKVYNFLSRSGGLPAIKREWY